MCLPLYMCVYAMMYVQRDRNIQYIIYYIIYIYMYMYICRARHRERERERARQREREVSLIANITLKSISRHMIHWFSDQYVTSC